MRPLAAALVAAFSFSALAQEHHHPPEDAGIHEKFYKTWMRPDHPTLSCCDLKDCYPSEAKFERGNWYAKQRETGQWVKIPPEKIEHNRDAPDARAHVCMSPYGDVFCFIVASGT